MQRTIYFKDKHGDAERISEIISQAGDIARALGIGTAADDLLAAIISGQVNLHISTPLESNPKLTLTQLLERAAAVLQNIDPILAEELRRKRVAVMAMLQ